MSLYLNLTENNKFCNFEQRSIGRELYTYFYFLGLTYVSIHTNASFFKITGHEECFISANTEMNTENYIKKGGKVDESIAIC